MKDNTQDDVEAKCAEISGRQCPCCKKNTPSTKEFMYVYAKSAEFTERLQGQIS